MISNTTESKKCEKFAIKRKFFEKLNGTDTVMRERNYFSFGKLLEGWRIPKFSTAQAMFKKRKFSYSYGTYVAFERGEGLPNLKQVLEVADALELDPRRMVLFWLQAQMPTRELKWFATNLIDSNFGTNAQEEEEKPVNKFVAPPASLENTWILSPKDGELLAANPWLWELLVLLIMNYPNFVRLSGLKLPKGVTNENLTKRHLKAWIATGHIETGAEGLRVALPHLHLPNTPLMRQLRADNMRRGVESLIEDGPEAYRMLHYGNLTPEQRSAWVAKLKKLQEDFLAEICIEGPGRSPHVLVFGLGPWTPMKTEA